MKGSKDILVIRLSALGDVAMTIPAIYSVATSYPQHTFHVVTSSFCSLLFINAPHNIVMHPAEDRSANHILNDLKSTHIDAVADLHNVLRSWRIDLHYLLRGKRVAMLDKHRDERYAITHRHKVTKKPFTERYLDVFARLGLETSPCPSYMRGEASPISGKSLQPPEDMKKGGSKRWIGIAPFSRYKNKIYPLHMMQEVVNILAEHEDVVVLLFGSRGKEAETLKSWCKKDNVISIAGKYSLVQELAIISRLDIMVSMDSANMHLASLVGARVISIWGGTTPACGFLGWRQSIDDTIMAGVDCQPCTIGGSDKCRYGDYHCMTSIRPQDIIDKLSLLSTSPLAGQRDNTDRRFV